MFKIMHIVYDSLSSIKKCLCKGLNEKIYIIKIINSNNKLSILKYIINVKS
jgi:hypothetical protein